MRAPDLASLSVVFDCFDYNASYSSPVVVSSISLSAVSRALLAFFRLNYDFSSELYILVKKRITERKLNLVFKNIKYFKIKVLIKIII